MPSPITRTPPYGAPRPSATPDDEEEQDSDVPVGDSPPPLAPIAPVARTQPYSRPVQPAARRLSDDPTQRAEESVAAAEAAFAAKQRATNPFVFSNDIRSLAKEGGRKYIDRAIRQGERDYEDQLQNDRAAAVAARRSEVEAQKATNAEREARFRGTGQKFYTDPYGNMQPVLDPQGRALYSPTPWTASKHPKTGLPVLEMQDQFGQRQFKRPKLAGPTDPEDEYLYADLGDGESVPYMTKADAAKSSDVSLAKLGQSELKRARAHQYGKIRQQKGEEIASAAQENEAVNAEIAAEKTRVVALQQRAAQIQSTNPEEASKLEQEAYDAQTALDKNQGDLGFRKIHSDAKLAYTKAKASRDGYLLNQQEMAERLREEGKDPATDPLYQSNLRGLQTWEAGLLKAEQGLREVEGLRNAPVPAAPVSTEEPSKLAQTAKSFARGATAEGIYAAGEGGSRLFAESPVRRGLNALEDWATEKIQGFPLTDQQKATRAKLRQRAEEKTGAATVDRFARDYAKATSDLREDIRRALPVDQKFAQSRLGQISQGVGQLAGTTAIAAATGGAGIAGTSVAQIYDEAYQDAKQSGADDATAHQAAMKYLPAASLDYLADKMVVGKLLKPLVGKMTVGRFVKDVLATAAAEGGTEGAQQLYLNQIAKKLEGYDPNRPFDKEVLDSVIVGAALGGGASTLGNVGHSLRGRGAEPESGSSEGAPAPDAPAPEGTVGGATDRSETEIAEEEFQKRLDERLSPEEKALFERLSAQGQPVNPQAAIDANIVGAPAAVSAEESALAIASQPSQVHGDSGKSARASAQALLEAENTQAQQAADAQAAESAKEERIQSLVDQLSEGNDAERARILSLRQNISPEDFLSALEGAADYRRNPAGQPDIVAQDVQREVDAVQNAPINGETSGITNVGRIIPAELEAQADLRATDEAQRVARAMAEVGGDQAFRPDIPAPEPTLRDEPPQRAAESAQAIEQGVSEEERLRRSGKGANKLALDLQRQQALSNENTPIPQPVADEPAGATAEVPVSEPEQPTPDVPAGAPLAERNLTGTTPEEAAYDAENQRKYDEAEATRAAREKAGLPPPKPLESLPAAIRRLGRQRVQELIGDWNWDADLHEDGTKIVALNDSRNPGGRGRISTKDFMSWLAEHPDGQTKTSGRPPVTDDPEVVARDRRQYDVLNRRLSSLTKKLGVNVLASPEYQAAWQAMEDIKNRHGGMPPGETSPPISNEQETVSVDESAAAPVQETSVVQRREPDGEPPAPTSELRKNNAGLNLPPVSSLTAPQKLAELKAGGIATYAGKPIEDANPAQLSNALGKLRRGELTPEGEKPGAPLVTDRLIGELERLKKGKRVPGAEYFVDPDGKPLSVKDRAFDTALDIAILGLRAGRPLEQIIRLAVARYRAVHQTATDEEVSKLTNAITEAAGQPAPEVSKKKSAVQQSLKESGLPVRNQDYDVRAQDERVKEASDFIAKNGDVAAEAALSDREIPADTRVAIGGELLRSKMQAMKKASPEEVSLLTKDIRRIAEATRSNVSTEAGQGVAMHSRIYQDLGVQSSMDYVRSVQKNRLEKMGGEQAEQAAAEAAEAFNKTKDQAKRDAAIERLKKRYTEKPVVKMLNALKGLERAQELNNLGVLTRDDMIDVAGKALGLPGVSGEKLKHIATLVDKVEKAPNLAEAEKAQIELTETMAKYKGISKMDLETALFTLNVLTSVNTQTANAAGNAIRLMTELASVAAVNRTSARQRALWSGFKDGLPLGWEQAKSIWQTGRGTRDLEDKTLGTGSVVERADYKELLPNWPEAVTSALNMRKDAMAKVGRFMRSVDALAYYPAREAMARMQATKYFEGTLHGPALEKRVAEIMHSTPRAIQEARDQAKREGYSGISASRRASEIIEARRKMTPEGEKAANEGELFAANTTYTNEPEGLAGVIYRGADYVVKNADIEGLKLLKPWLMFLRTPANITNATKNYTPFGLLEPARGKTKTKEGYRLLSEDEINRRYFQASIGSALLAGVGVAVAKGLMDVTEGGPDDPEKRKQLIASGWRPYSFRIGKGPYISYRDTPLVAPLSTVGMVSDDYKYNGASKENAAQQAAAAFLWAPVKSIGASSPLGGVADLLNAVLGKSTTSATRNIAGIPANVLIPGVRLASEVDRYQDPTVYDSNLLQQSVPFLRRQGAPRSDIEGRTVESRPSDRFFGSPTSDPLDRVLADRGLFIPAIGSSIKIGKEEMTDEQKEAYKRISGQRIRQRLLLMVPMLQHLDAERATDLIKRVTDEERNRAKGAVRRMPVKR